MRKSRRKNYLNQYRFGHFLTRQAIHRILAPQFLVDPELFLRIDFGCDSRHTRALFFHTFSGQNCRFNDRQAVGAACGGAGETVQVAAGCAGSDG